MSFFYMQLSSFLSKVFEKNCLFFIVDSCLFYCRLINHKYIGLFLVSSFSSTDKCLILYQYHTFYYYNFVVQSEVREPDSSSDVLSQEFFGLWDIFCFHISFKIICFSSLKNIIGILIRTALNLQITLESILILTISYSNHEHSILFHMYVLSSSTFIIVL